MESLAFESLASHLETGEYDGQRIEVKKPSIDLSTEIISIEKNVTLCFDSSAEIECKQMRFTSCTAKISNLNLKGSIWTKNCQLTLINCRIHDAPRGIDHIISLNDNSNIYMNSCTVESSPMFGICLDTHSTGMLDHCTFDHSVFPSIAIFGFSLIRIMDCTIQNSGAELIWVDTESDIFLSNSTLRNSKKRALYVAHGANANILSSTFTGCEFGAMSFFATGNVLVEHCDITDCSHTAIYVERSTVELKKININGSKGNAVNASKSSKVTISDCSLQNTTFPLVAICDSSVGVIKRCFIGHGSMSGIVIRFNSQALIKDTQITDVEHTGISASDCQDILIKNSTISNCKRTGIEAYNESKISVVNVDIDNAMTDGIDIFAGSYIDMKKFTVSGSTHAAVWLHHGARCFMKKGMIWYDKGEGILDETNHSVSFMKIEVNNAPIENKVPELSDSSEDSEEDGESESHCAKCIVCGKSAIGVHFNPCAHCVYCKECWNTLKDKPKVCPLCKFSIEGIMRLYDDSHDQCEGKCGICFDRTPNTVVTPCGHMMCTECANSWFAENSECPFCRAPGARPRKLINYQ